MRKKKVLCGLLIFAFIQLIAFLGGYYVNISSQWYGSVNLPSFIPHPWVFIAAWTLIYIFTGIAAFISCISGQRTILYAYALNGALNALWTYVFFYKGNIVGGLFIIGLLILNVLYLIKKSIDKRSKILLLPYLFWLMVAAILNYSIFMLN